MMMMFSVSQDRRREHSNVSVDVRQVEHPDDGFKNPGKRVKRGRCQSGARRRGGEAIA